MMIKVKILYGFRGRETNERYYPAGEYEFEDGLARLLIADGHAVAIETDIDKAVSQLHSKLSDAVDNMVIKTLQYSLDELRKIYQEKTGKKAYHAWDVAMLEQKLTEWDANNA